ncbi:hypothetical protein CLF_113350, partial [Clonorchis sinensis]
VIDFMLADAGSDCMIPQGEYHVTRRRHVENNTVLAVPVYVVCGDETSITIPSLARLLCVLPLRIACLLTMMGISARVSSKLANSAMTPYEPSMSTPRMSGWTDRNAILEFFARPAPTPRPAAVSQTAKCTPAIRPQKGYKEFKFYHYADPDAYIVQYRYDCSSVASRRCDDGPLEQFVVLNYKGEPISKS